MADLTPEEQKEINKRTRTARATAQRVDRVNQRIASRLVTYGWKVIAPDGTEWTVDADDMDELRDSSKIPWAKY